MSLESSPSSPHRRLALGTFAAALAFGCWPRAARAQGTPVRFQLDSRLDGPAACFVLPAAKGYFRQEGLDVTLDAGIGAASTIGRVAAGQHDRGCADLAALMEIHANHPGGPGKPVAVMIVHSNTAAAVLALKRSGIRAPADLGGKRLGGAAADPGHRAWPLFARANAIDPVAWSPLEAAQSEALLLRGELDAITGTAYSALPGLEARGARAEDVVLLPYAQYGVKLYGQAIIASDEFVRRKPEAVRALLRAFARGMRDVVADPRAAVALVQARDPSLDAERELRRLRLALDLSMLTADARTEGFGAVTGPRLALMASPVSDAFGTRERVNANAVWNGSFLPGVAERNLFAVARHA
jgi:NitT/TauT family transport system substrate-binding protein